MQTEFKNLLQGMKQTGEKIFLVENDRYYSYSQLAEDVVALADKVKGKNAVVVEAVNTYSFYVKIMALLLNKIPFLLLPPYQFHDLEFRTFLASEVQVDFYFSNLQDSFQEEVSNAGFISNEWIKQMVARGGSLFIVKTTGSSGKKFKFILHDALLFLGKYRLYNKTFDSTLAFSPAESIAGVETFLESVCLAKTLIACGEKPSPQKVVELIDKHRVDLFQTTPSFLNLMIISGLVTEKSLKTLRQVFFWI